MPVGKGGLGPLGMAFLRTRRTENCAGSMVAGSKSRFMSMAALLLFLGSWSLEVMALVARRKMAGSCIMVDVVVLLLLLM